MAEKRGCRRQLSQRCSGSEAEVAEDAVVIPRRTASLDLIGKLCNPDTSIAEIQHILETNATLSHQILSAGGTGAASGLCRPITSIRQAVVLLGRRRLQGWISLTLLADIHVDSAKELILALTRARMCELLVAHTAPDERDAAFAVGLISGLERVVHRPLPALIAQLHIGGDIAAAVIDRTGLLGAVLADVLAWECDAEGSGRDFSGANLPTVDACYVDALQWATDLAALVDAATG